MVSAIQDLLKVQEKTNNLKHEETKRKLDKMSLVLTGIKMSSATKSIKGAAQMMLLKKKEEEHEHEEY